jgi:hypothetical protein
MGARPMNEETEEKDDIDLLFDLNKADIDALQDAEITLQAIKEADPGTYDEIIDESLRLIQVALSNSFYAPIERIIDAIEALKEKSNETKSE